MRLCLQPECHQWSWQLQLKVPLRLSADPERWRPAAPIIQCVCSYTCMTPTQHPEAATGSGHCQGQWHCATGTRHTLPRAVFNKLYVPQPAEPGRRARCWHCLNLCIRWQRQPCHWHCSAHMNDIVCKHGASVWNFDLITLLLSRARAAWLLHAAVAVLRTAAQRHGA